MGCRIPKRNEEVNWLILIVAGLCEVVWAVALKMSNGLKLTAK
jgi:multidrug transporter EmrE-like cation transporter